MIPRTDWKFGQHGALIMGLTDVSVKVSTWPGRATPPPPGGVGVVTVDDLLLQVHQVGADLL